MICTRGILEQLQATRTAMKFYNLTIILTVPLIFLIETGFSQFPTHKTYPSLYDWQAKDRKSGKAPFFGTWADYFSSFLTIHVNGSFTYTRGTKDNPISISGTWKRNLDTFYFSQSPVGYKTKTLDSIQPNWPADLPARLCYFRNKLYQVSPDGKLMTKKVFSTFSVKKDIAYRTLYYRDKKYNLNYFDSSYYRGTMNRKFVGGVGIVVMLTEVPKKPTIGSFGFTFSPRYIFNRRDNAYLSLGLPFTIGFSQVNIPTTVQKDEYFPHLGILVDLPLVLNYNKKWGSALKGGSRFGYFVGLGAAYHLNDYSVATDTTSTIDHINGFGPVFNAGIRYAFTKYRVPNLELKFSYLRMIVSSTPSIYGISLLINR